MIQTKRGLLLIAVLTLTIALVVKFPARVAYQWAAPAGIAASGIHGSAWRGRADALSINGVYLANVSWRLLPLRLLTGKASYRIKGSPVSGFIEGDIGFGFGGRVSGSNLVASLPLQLLAQSLNISGLSGDATVRFDRVQIKGGLPVAADGTIEVSNLVAPRLSRDPIGGFRAEFFTGNNGVTATVEDTNGVVDLAGSLQINDDRSYQFLGKVAAKPDAPSTLRRQLQYLGSPDDRGQRELRLEGAL